MQEQIRSRHKQPEITQEPEILPNKHFLAWKDKQRQATMDFQFNEMDSLKAEAAQKKERIKKELCEDKEGGQQQSFSEYDLQLSQPKAQSKSWEDGPELQTEGNKTSGRGEWRKRRKQGG